MNKIALRNFATQARTELRDKIKIKALQLGITEENIEKETVQSSDAAFIDGRQLTIDEKQQRNMLIEEINIKGYNQVIEEVSYTWFNRFTALRFMEVNNYLPTKVRVLSSEIEGSYEPDIIKEALNIDLDVDKDLVYRLKTSSENDAIDRLYKYLILLQCDSLSTILPFMFGKTNDFTKLLFPDGLLADGSFLREITNLENFPEENWKDVEIIGWLYQYYIADENQRVIQAKKRYKKEEIPFATQLFTPEWIVRYMVQNALGRYWVESHPEDRDLIENWEYYLENPNPEPDFEEKLAPYLNKNMKVEDIKCFDPAMGSGHILVYIFDVLYEIYVKSGYMEREIPKLIIENNLYGLEIDDRAYQLACFAVIMKAQQYNPRFLRSLERQVNDTGEYIELNLASIQETNDFNIKDIEYLAGEEEGDNFDKAKLFIEQFEKAEIYGSLTEIKEFDEEFLNKRAETILKETAGDLEYQSSKEKVGNIILDLIKQTKIMNEIYDVLVTNPPYMGSNYMNEELSLFIKKKYDKFKSDVFTVFINYSINKVKNHGYLGFLSPYVWMYLSSYNNFRKEIINNTTITSLIQLEYNAFPEACVPVCTFTLRNNTLSLSGEYIRLSEFPGSEIQETKTLEAINSKDVSYRFTRDMNDYKDIPNNPIAYWVSDRVLELFRNDEKIKDIAKLKSGRSTGGKNDELLRFWHEVSHNTIQFNVKHYSDITSKWIPLNKGGGYRRWYGNLEYVCDNVFCPKLDDEFSLAITWSDINSHYFSARIHLEGIIANNVGKRLYIEEKYFKYILGFLNTPIAEGILDLIIPTLHFDIGYVGNLPVIIDKMQIDIISEIVNYNIKISKDDWDSVETSWEFRVHSFLKDLNIGGNYKLESIFNIWETDTNESFNQLKYNEEELNRIFIDIYGLQDELTPQVEDKDITISKADRERDIKSFLSYGVGCMLGRYSLDEEGLAYAGGEFDIAKYKTFPADKDNIIPILSDSYFEDDIVSKFEEFVKITFGETNLNENLKYIAESLGVRKDETPKETIRRYFVNDFYKTHTQIYKKRPIYWLFTSGKEKAFNALIYMHRYDRSTLARIRTDYLHALQSRLDVERANLKNNIAEEDNTAQKKRYEKQLRDLEKKIDELQKYDEKLHTMADKMIEIDLDDGVKDNYEIFKGLVAKI